MIRLLEGDALTVLKTLDSESVQCAITSPPYKGLRDYGVEGQIGLEPTVEAHLEALVNVFREVKRVLRRDGLMFLNYGDSYGSKGLLEMPSRLALALAADGWIERSRCPWVKRNPLPESAKDRPSSAVEYIFLFAKRPTYFYDGEAVRKENDRGESGWSRQRERGVNTQQYGRKKRLDGAMIDGKGLPHWDDSTPTGRNRRNSDFFFESWQGMTTDEDGLPQAFVVNPAPFAGSHFATFPPKLVEPMIKSGTSQYGACAATIKKLRIRPDLSGAELEKVMGFLKSRRLI